MNLADSRTDCPECQGDALDCTYDQRRDYMMTQEHTATPWTFASRAIQLRTKDAAYIVQCVNSHADLVAALGLAATMLERITMVQTRSAHIIQQTTQLVAKDLRAALLKAQG